MIRSLRSCVLGSTSHRNLRALPSRSALGCASGTTLGQRAQVSMLGRTSDAASNINLVASYSPVVDKIWQNTTSSRLNVSKRHSRSGSSIMMNRCHCKSATVQQTQPPGRCQSSFTSGLSIWTQDLCCHIICQQKQVLCHVIFWRFFFCSLHIHFCCKETRSMFKLLEMWEIRKPQYSWHAFSFHSNRDTVRNVHYVWTTLFSTTPLPSRPTNSEPSN